jgi:putative Ca2+/H+ antiporter (TMEM165/GDT1 family)
MGSMLTAATLVFVAELCDKTQLVALGFGARHRLGPVVVGLALGYATANLLSVLVGATIGAALPVGVVTIGSGLLFLGLAARYLLGSDDADDGDDVEPLVHGRVVLSVAATLVVAELGDKTMLATAALAAEGAPVEVWAGATVGIVASGLLGVLAGRAVNTRLTPRRSRLQSAGTFAFFGCAVLVAELG